MPLGSEEELTISEKMLLHLSNYRKYHDDYFVPFAIVQGGIATALKIYRSEVSRTLKRLKDQGLVEERVVRVEGIKRRRKAYFVTNSGLELVKKLKDKLDTKNIVVKMDSGEKKVKLSEIPEVIDKKMSMLDIINNLSQDTLDVSALTKKESPKPVPQVFGYELIGRIEELDELRAFFDDSRNGKARAVVISGEAGVGKTRLVSELKAVYKDMHFLEGSCLYQTGADPYLPFVDLITGFFKETSSKVLKDKVNPEAVTAGLGSLLLTPDDTSSSELSGKLEYERVRIFEYITNTFITIASERPTAIFIDDLHWADAGTIYLFHYLTRNIKNNRIVIIGCYRPEEIALESDHPLHEVLMRMRKENLITEMELERLNLKETGELIGSYLKREDVPEDFIHKIYNETDGNPFFIEEVLNSLEDDNAIQYSDDGWEFPSKINIPSSVRETLGRRFNKLSKSERTTLDVAAVIGNRFDLDVLLEILHNEDITLDSVDRLLKAHLIEEEDGKKEFFRFHHDKIREVVYDELSKPRLKLLHKKIGETLEAIYRDNLNEAVTMLAHHFSRSNENQKAYDYCLKAAEKGEKLYSYEEAIAFYKSALEAIDSMHMQHKVEVGNVPIFDESENNEDEVLDRDFFDEVLDPNIYLKNRKADILLKMGDAYDVLAQWEKSRKNYEDAYVLTKDVRKRSLIYSKIGKVLRRLGSYEEGLKYCAKALEWLEGLEGAEKALIYDTTGLIYYSKGDIDKALEHCEKGLVIMRKMEDDKGVATLLNTIGIMYHHKGNYKKSLGIFNESVDIRKRMKDERGLASSYNNIGNHYIYLGDYNKALEYYSMSSELFEKTGDIQGLSSVCNNMGLIYVGKQDFDKALDYYEKSLAIADKIGEAQGISTVANNTGELYCLRKDYDKALKYYNKSMELCKKTGGEVALMTTYVGLAEVYLGKGELDEALGYVTEAIKHSQRLGRLDNLAVAYRVAACIYREKGQLDSSLENFEAAIELFQRFGNEIELGMTYYEYGLMFKKKKNTKKAEEYFEKSLELLQKFQDDYSATQICEELNKFLKRRG